MVCNLLICSVVRVVDGVMGRVDGDSGWPEAKRSQMRARTRPLSVMPIEICSTGVGSPNLPCLLACLSSSFRSTATDAPSQQPLVICALSVGDKESKFLLHGTMRESLKRFRNRNSVHRSCRLNGMKPKPSEMSTLSQSPLAQALLSAHGCVG